MLVCWVNLGDEMEESWMLERAWFQGEKEREVLLKIRGRRRRSLLGNSLWTSALSLGWQKGIEGGRMLRLYQKASAELGA